MSNDKQSVAGYPGSAICATEAKAFASTVTRVRNMVLEAKLAALNTAIASGNFPLTKDNAERAAEAIEAAFAKIKY